MSQIRGLERYHSYPLAGNLNPVGGFPLFHRARPFYSYPLTGNLNAYKSYPLVGNLNPLGQWEALLGTATKLIGGMIGGSKAATPPITVVNEPPPQPAPPVPFNWTPVIVAGGVTLVALTLIMTTKRK